MVVLTSRLTSGKIGDVKREQRKGGRAQERGNRLFPRPPEGAGGQGAGGEADGRERPAKRTGEPGRRPPSGGGGGQATAKEKPTEAPGPARTPDQPPGNQKAHRRPKLDKTDILLSYTAAHCPGPRGGGAPTTTTRAAAGAPGSGPPPLKTKAAPGRAAVLFEMCN